MNLMRWDPFREFLNASRMVSATRESDDAYGAWSPLVDIFERGEDLVIRAEVPGVDRDQLDVRVEDNVLTLSGERKGEKSWNDEGVYRLERSYGSFVRSFRLPKVVDASSIRAEYLNGVLELTLPKVEAARPRKIEIKVA